MPVKTYVKGIVRRVRAKFYAPVYSMTKAIGARTELILTGLGIRRVTPQEVRERGLSPDISPDTLIIKSSITPFSSQIIFDPRFKRYIDQATKRIVSKAEMRKRLNLHRRDVLLTSAKQRKPDVSDVDLIATVDKIEEDREKLREALLKDEAKEEIRELEELIDTGLEELGVDTP